MDHAHGVRFKLDGDVLTTTAYTRAARRAVRGKRIDAICATSFTNRRRKVVTTRLWPRGRRTVRFHFERDVSHRVKWCLLEHRAADVAMVDFVDPPEPD